MKIWIYFAGSNFENQDNKINKEQKNKWIFISEIAFFFIKYYENQIFEDQEINLFHRYNMCNDRIMRQNQKKCINFFLPSSNPKLIIIHFKRIKVPTPVRINKSSAKIFTYSLRRKIKFFFLFRNWKQKYIIKGNNKINW